MGLAGSKESEKSYYPFWQSLVHKRPGCAGDRGIRFPQSSGKEPCSEGAACSGGSVVMGRTPFLRHNASLRCWGEKGKRSAKLQEPGLRPSWPKGGTTVGCRRGNVTGWKKISNDVSTVGEAGEREEKCCRRRKEKSQAQLPRTWASVGDFSGSWTFYFPLGRNLPGGGDSPGAGTRFRLPVRHKPYCEAATGVADP